MAELYGTSHIASIEEAANDQELLELFLIDDVLRGTNEQIANFCESQEAAILIEQGVLKKNALVRMNTLESDFNRRVKLTAYQLAKAAKSPDFEKLVKYSRLKKEYATKILNKYGAKAARIAKIAQKNYIKKAKAAKSAAEGNKTEE